MNFIVALVRKGTVERVYHVFERWENLQKSVLALLPKMSHKPGLRHWLK